MLELWLRAVRAGEFGTAVRVGEVLGGERGSGVRGFALERDCDHDAAGTQERGSAVGAACSSWWIRPRVRPAAAAISAYDGGVSLGVTGTADPTDVAERAGRSVETLHAVHRRSAQCQQRCLPC